MRDDGNPLVLPKGADSLLRDLIQERTGLYYDDRRRADLLDRLAPLVLERGFQSYLDYFYLLRYDPNGAGEWARVIDVLSVQETYFWREADQLAALVDVMVPDAATRTAGRPLRIWSVPCASGEEPISLAIALNEAGWLDRLPIEIEASDASELALGRAREGRYRERAFRALPPALREKYFIRDRETWLASPDLRRRIRWSRVNLACAAEVRPMATASIIFCRNVFIYFSERTIRETVRVFAEAMPVHGYLCVGAAESLLKVTDAFDLQQVGTAFVYVKR